MKTYKDAVIRTLTVGEMEVNCYLLTCLATKQTAIIDPGEEAELIINVIKNEGLKPVMVINTHGHADHIGANDEIKSHYNLPLLIGELDAPMLSDPKLNLSSYLMIPIYSPSADKLLKENEIVTIGNVNLEVKHTPGHSIGSIILIHKEFAIVGDVIFYGSVGRTDFPGGSFEVLKHSIESRIFCLRNELDLYPGHGEATTVGFEKKYNPFLQD